MKQAGKLSTLLATGLYTGYFPFAPATFSTLVLGIPLYLLVSRLNLYWYGFLLLPLTVVAVRLSDTAEKIFQKKDCSFIVIDELAGFLITMFMVPQSITTVILGFFLFRFFDIVKPPPANFFNTRKKGGLDVVLDDVFAGIYANLVLQVAAHFVLK
jgi:phosphatidylglycerophosphatase A